MNLKQPESIRHKLPQSFDGKQAELVTVSEHVAQESANQPHNNRRPSLSDFNFNGPTLLDEKPATFQPYTYVDSANVPSLAHHKDFEVHTYVYIRQSMHFYANAFEIRFRVHFARAFEREYAWSSVSFDIFWIIVLSQLLALLVYYISVRFMR